MWHFHSFIDLGRSAGKNRSGDSDFHKKVAKRYTFSFYEIFFDQYTLLKVNG